MSISAIGVSQTSSLVPVSLSSVAPTTSTDTQGSSDQTQVSKMGQLMSKLQDLESSDPAKAKAVLQQIASKLQSAASSSGDSDESAHLSALASKFSKAAETGDLSGLQPPQGGASGSASASASASGSSATGAYHRHAHAHHKHDSSQVSDIISQALDSVDGSATASTTDAS